MKKLRELSSNEYIPPEVLTQILVNLPVKTLIRFRCVCKSWCSIIDDPDFVYMHLQCYNHHKKINSDKILTLEGLGIIGSDGCVLTLRKVNNLKTVCQFLKSSERYHIYGTCNSLVLLCPSRHYRFDGIRLCNTSIRKSLLLPPCPLYPCHEFTTTFVLGFAPRSKDFKVIAISFDLIQGLGQMRVAVYTLSDQQWSVRNNGLNLDYFSFVRVFKSCLSLSNACYFEGAAHWLGKHPDGDSQGFQPTILVSLNFDTENFEFFELPAQLETVNWRLLFLLRGSLAILRTYSKSADIWVLKQESGKRDWMLWFTGPLTRDGYLAFFPTSLRPRLLFYEDAGCFVYCNKFYNIATCQVREVGRQVEFEMYSESLILCKGYGAKDMASSPFCADK